MITVLIPTFNRPHLLRVALESIAKQTYLSYIDKVIVSENGLNNSSSQVCAEFSQLNIQYVYQEEQLPVLKHIQWLMSLEANGYVAFLCDDDWWNIYHIELAVNSLKKYPDNVSYFSDFLFASNDKSLEFSIYNNAKFLASRNNKYVNYDLFFLKTEDIIFSSVLVTPFHFSALVCNANILSKVAYIFDEVHPTYSDRMLWVVLSSYGGFIFNPLPTTVIRNHAEQDSNNYSSLEWRNNNQAGSLQVLLFSEEKNIDVKGMINDAYVLGNSEERMNINQEMERVFVNRDNIIWYKGYNDIIAVDQQKLKIEYEKKIYEASVKYKLIKFARKCFK